MTPREAAAIRSRAKLLGLCASDKYWSMPAEVLARIAGGCGPGGKGDYLVPDTMYWLNVTPACHIHDVDYALGETIEDKDKADRTFKNNMLRIIDAAYNEPHWMPKVARRGLRKLRRVRANTYYQSVHQFGGPSFWEGKKDGPSAEQYVDEPEREFEP